MFRLLSTLDCYAKCPAIVRDVLHVGDAHNGEEVRIRCADIEDVYLPLLGFPPTSSRIVLLNGKTIIADSDPDLTRELWLAWAEDNLRYTTEVHRAK